MEIEAQVRILMAGALEDREGAGSLQDLAQGLRARQPLDPINIRPLAARGGFPASRLFRILLTNACSFSCSYCPMRAGREIPRRALVPAVLARVFLKAYRNQWVSGLFVTSGIPRSPRWAMDRMLELGFAPASSAPRRHQASSGDLFASRRAIPPTAVGCRARAPIIGR